MRILKAKTEEDASWLSLLIVGGGVLVIMLLLELPAWVMQYGFNFWSVLK